MGKKFGINSKKEEARIQKQGLKEKEAAKKQKQQEDAKWVITDKQRLKKEKEKEEEEAKKREKLQLKEEKERQLEIETKEILAGKAVDTKPKKKKTKKQQQMSELKRNQINAMRKKMGLPPLEEKSQKDNKGETITEDQEQNGNTDDDEQDEDTLNRKPLIKQEPLEPNVNHLAAEENEGYDEVFIAHGIDDFIKQDKLKEMENDRHPERRMKAAWNAYIEENFEKYRKENPGLRRNQILERLHKEFEKDPLNPMNASKKSYNYKPGNE